MFIMSKKFNLEKLNICLVVILLVVLTVGIYYSSSINKMLRPPKPLSLELTTITADCKQCFDVGIIVSALKQQPGIKIKSEKNMTRKDAKKLIDAYGIKKLPTLLIEGDVEKLELKGFEKKKGALVFTETPLPYYNVTAKSITGIVSYTVLQNPECSECTDINSLVSQLKSLGVATKKKAEVDVKEEDGKALAEKYKITKVPTLILSKNALNYDVISQVWEKVGTIEEDGMLVLREINPPYYDISMDELRGRTELTYLADDSCKECYNPEMHKEILTSNFGLFVSNEKTLDIKETEGRKLVVKYDIQLVPTVIITGDLDAYTSLKEIWKQVGTVEKDAYVFRNIELLQGVAYKNLTSGKTVNATESSESN